MSEATVVKMWEQLVQSRPRLKAVLRALKEGDKTLYDLQQIFNTSSIYTVLKDMVELGVIDVTRGEKMPSGMIKKYYGLTELGRKLAKA